MESQTSQGSDSNKPIYRIFIRIASIIVFGYAISLCYGNNCTYTECYGITEDLEKILVAIVYSLVGIALILFSNTIKDK